MERRRQHQKQQVLSRFFAPAAPVPSSTLARSPSATSIDFDSPIKQTSDSSPRNRHLPADGGVGLGRLDDQKDCTHMLSDERCHAAESDSFEEVLPHKRQRTEGMIEKEHLSDKGERMVVSQMAMQVSSIKRLETTPSDVARHERFVETLLTSIGSEPLPGSKPSKRPSKDAQYTPLEQQVLELKAKHKDVLLMIEVGYRYRFFGEDAEIASRVLGIFAYNDHNFITASIPTYRLHVHVRRLVEAGYKVGVVRQTETAAIKAHGSNKAGPFMRGLSALYSRATLEAAADLGGEPYTETGRCRNYLMCIVEQHVDGPKSIKETKRRVESDAVSVAEAPYDCVIGIVAVETATGDVMFGQFKDTVTRTELETHILACSPAELVISSPVTSATEKVLLEFSAFSSNARLERVSRDTLGDSAMAEVLEFYGGTQNGRFEAECCQMEGRVDESLEAILALPELVIQALVLALRYLRNFGLERVLRLGATFKPLVNSCELILSSNTLQQLEILQNNADGTLKGSLLWLMDHTHTAFGARLFHYWLIHPLRDQTLISARLDAVSEIADLIERFRGSQNDGFFPGSGRGSSIAFVSKDCIGAVLMSLKKAPDIERGITRIFHGTASSSEFIAVIHALLTVIRQLQQTVSENEDGMVKCSSEKVSNFRSPLLRRLLETASSSVVSAHASRLLSFLNEEAAHSGDKHNLFICGTDKFSMVENCKAAVKSAEQCLDCVLSRYRELLKNPNLQYLNVSGSTHLIEVPAAQRVPPNWIKVNATKKTNRYHSPEVLQALDVLILAKEELTVECNKAWNTFLAEFGLYYVEFRATVHALAALDCLYSLAIVSRNQGYTRPTFVEEESAQLIIEGGRHPVLEATLNEGFVPNDTFLHADNERCQIITGPNMGGKSCYIRQVALTAVMAQVGSYVPANSVKLHAFDAIYTRMGGSDNIQCGSSTFLEELNEASIILRNATQHSLVIMDELGRGTSTHDGVAIAFATLEYLVKNIKCLTLFVTHYPKLTELNEKYPNEIGAYHVSYLAEKLHQPNGGSKVTSAQFPDGYNSVIAVTNDNSEEDITYEADQKIVFLYKLVKGVARRSFGLYVARLAQIPESCIVRASTMAARLEKEVQSRVLQMTDNMEVKLLPTIGMRQDILCRKFETSGEVQDSCANESMTESVIEDYGNEVDGLYVAQVSKLFSAVVAAILSAREETFLPELKTIQAETRCGLKMA